MAPYKNKIPGLKWCSGCKEFKEVQISFSKNRAAYDGLQAICNSCKRKLGSRPESKDKRNIRSSNPENREKKRQYDAKRQASLKYKEIKQKYDSEYRSTSEFKDKIKFRYSTDVQFHLGKALRSRLRKVLKTNAKKGSAVSDLGCTIPELKLHLEKQFQPGMSWENWGFGNDKWHIDHIKPLASFDLTQRDQLLKACHYTNLQPLWQKENLSKKDKIIWPVNIWNDS